MKKTYLSKLLALSMAAVLGLTACGGGNGDAPADAEASGNTETAAAKEGGEEAGEGAVGKTDIIFAMKSDISSLDPQAQNDTTSGVLLNHVYERLMKIDNDGNIVPSIAKEWTMVDDTTWKFVLDENAKFSDGSAVTANDVKFTLDRAAEMAKTKSSVAKIEEVIVDSEHEVTVKLNQPYAPLIAILADTKMGILSEAAVTAAGEKYGEVETIVGSGPFVVTEWVPNDHYTLVRNENYWQEAPVTTSLTCRVIPEGSARAIALETGEVDLVWEVDATDVINLEANKDIACEPQLAPSVEYLGMNTQKELFADKRVRQAVNYALDKQSFVDTILEGRGEVANSVFSKMVPGWNEELEAYPYDVEKAKALMAEAGYPDGFSCKLYVSGDVRNRSAQLVQAQLAEIGITVDISMYEYGAFLDSLNAGEHDMFILGWSNSTFDAEDSTFPLFHSSNWGSTGNRAFLKDEALDEAIVAASMESDSEKRLQMYKDIQTTLKDLSPWAPLYYQQRTVGRRADLKGFTLHKGGKHDLRNLHYEK